MDSESSISGGQVASAMLFVAAFLVSLLVLPRAVMDPCQVQGRATLAVTREGLNPAVW